MPLFSAFTPFGQFEFSSDKSDAEKIYDAIKAGYTDPETGHPTLDMTPGTYQEAKIYGWAMAIAGANEFLKAAKYELRPETSYCLLEGYEKRYQTKPAATATVPERRALLLAKQKQARGPRFEALDEGLRAILGDSLLAIRPIDTTETETWPASPGNGPGVFNRHDTIAKTIRLLDSVARGTRKTGICDSYYPGLYDSLWGILTPGSPRVAQSFTGDGGTLEAAKFWIHGGIHATNVVAKIYAHSGTFGSTGIPTGAALATSNNFSITTDMETDSIEVYEAFFPFTGGNRITLVNGTKYFVSIEYATNDELSVAVTTNETYTGINTHPGNIAWDDGGGWDYEPTPDSDLFFEVITSKPGYLLEVAYENANTNAGEIQLYAGDVLTVDSGNLGLAEKVTVVEVEGTGEDRVFRAIFTKPHSAGALATTGTQPIWTSSKRHMLIVVDAATAVDPALVARVHAFMKQISRAPTTWAIVQPTTPGATTVGPFKIGSTTGSPLGAVPLDSMNIEV